MAHKLVSVKITKADREENTKPAEVAIDSPSYPWGLQIRLDEKTLEKLGIDDLPKVDSELMVIAKVSVVSVSSNEHSGGGLGKHKHKSVELQITELCLEDVPASKDAAEELYSKA